MPTARSSITIASLLGPASCETAMLRKYKSYASSFLGRVPPSPEAGDPPSVGTRPCRTLDVICSRIAILSEAATLIESRQTLRLFATSTASSVTSNWLPSVRVVSRYNRGGSHLPTSLLQVQVGPAVLARCGKWTDRERLDVTQRIRNFIWQGKP